MSSFEESIRQLGVEDRNALKQAEETVICCLFFHDVYTAGVQLFALR